MFSITSTTFDVNCLWDDELYKRLWRFIFARCGSKDIADEVIQNTYIISHKGITNLRNPDHFISWVHSIAIRELKQITKRTDLQCKNETNHDDLDSLITDIGDTTAESVFRLDIEKLLHECKSQDPVYQMVARQMVFDDATVKETAESTNLSESTVRRIRTSFVKMVRDALNGVDTIKGSKAGKYRRITQAKHSTKKIAASDRMDTHDSE